MFLTILQTARDFLSGDNGQMMYWTCAVAGTGFFAVSGFLALFGFGGADDAGDMDAHVDSGFSDFHLLSLKAIFAFIMMLGWGGVIFGRGNGYAGFFGAAVCGFAAMVLTASVIALLLKLQQNGTKSTAELVGMTGSVYLSIPANRSGTGKVVVNCGDDTREVKAVAEEALATGTPVKVVSVSGGGIVVVEKA